MQTTTFIIIAIIGILLAFVFFLKSKKTHLKENIKTDKIITEEKEHIEPKKYVQEKEYIEPKKYVQEKTYIKNDKIIIIEGANYLNIKKAVQQFCSSNNKGEFDIIINLSKFSENTSVITFPNDIEFSLFCYVVNYLYYPDNVFYTADIKAWATTKLGDAFIDTENANKYVMLFIPFDDEEYDNVYMTTEDNKGYKLGFSIGNPQKLVPPKNHFIENKFTIEEVEYKPSELIK